LRANNLRHGLLKTPHIGEFRRKGDSISTHRLPAALWATEGVASLRPKR